MIAAAAVKPGERVRQHPDPLDVDAGPARRLAVAADRVDVAAEARAVEQERRHDHQHEHDRDDPGDALERASGEWRAVDAADRDERDPARRDRSELEQREAQRWRDEAVRPAPRGAGQGHERRRARRRRRAGSSRRATLRLPNTMSADGGVEDPDRAAVGGALVVDDPDQEALPEEQARQRHDERRQAQAGDDLPLREADRRPDREAAGDRRGPAEVDRRVGEDHRHGGADRAGEAER